MCAARREVAFNDSPEDILNSSHVLETTGCQRSLYDRLMDCLKADDVEKVNAIISSDLKRCPNFTPLHFAAKAGACQVLLHCLDTRSHKIDCRDSTSETNTVLYWAIKEGHRDAVKVLLDRGASPNNLNIFDDDAVYVAVDFGHLEILQDLLKRGLDADGPERCTECPNSAAIDKRISCTSLCRAIMRDDDRMVSELIAYGADIYKQCCVLMENGLLQKHVYTSMHVAVSCCSSLGVITALLNAGYDLNMDFDKTGNPLLVAATQSRFDFVKLLLRHCNRSDVHAAVLRTVVNLGQLDLVKEVLGYELVDLNKTNTSHPIVKSYVHSAARHCYIDIVKYLIAKGANPCLDLCPHHVAEWLPSGSFHNRRAKENAHQKKTHLAYSEILSLLLETSGGKDLDNASPETGNTALYISCSRGLLCLSVQYIRSGADVHKANFSAISPLHCLVRDVVKPFSVNCDCKYRLIVMLLLFIVNFQPEFPWLTNLLTDADTFSKLIEPVQKLIQIRLTNPSSLLELTRAAIYQHLGANAHLKLKELFAHLPCSLRPFLELDDLIQVGVDIVSPMTKNNNSHLACICNPAWYLKQKLAN